MKGKAIGCTQLAISVLLYFLINTFYWKVLSLFGLHFIGNAYAIANAIKYLLITLVVCVIYHKNIKSSKRKFSKTFLSSVLYCIACFVFLIVITILLHKLLNYLGNPRGITVPYGFTNYFTQKFTLGFALNLIIECIFIPFLLCVMFPLGFSNVFRKSASASILAGLVYGIIYALGLHASFEVSLFYSITPAVVVFLLTYLYKANQNIWSVILTYICYVLFGILAINYIL